MFGIEQQGQSAVDGGTPLDRRMARQVVVELELGLDGIDDPPGQDAAGLPFHLRDQDEVLVPIVRDRSHGDVFVETHERQSLAQILDAEAIADALDVRSDDPLEPYQSLEVDFGAQAEYC